jgi:NTP pyrophosphatase (non-canonical NTP hydrolase)
MEIKKAQEKIEEFDKARGWENSWIVKDLSLNLVEEVGELWSLIKWVDEDTEKKIISENKEQASDFIGDALFLVLKLANKFEVDASISLEKTLEEYEKRMPEEKMKQVKHGNRLAGGHDNKE